MPKGIPAKGVRAPFSMSFREIAQEIGTTENYARLIYDRAIKKIRSKPQIVRQFAEMVRESLRR